MLTKLNNMVMPHFSSPVLLMNMGAWMFELNTMLSKERNKQSIFTSQVTLLGTNLCVKLFCDKESERLESG